MPLTFKPFFVPYSQIIIILRTVIIAVITVFITFIAILPPPLQPISL